MSLALTNENKDWLASMIIESKDNNQELTPKHKGKYSDEELENLFSNRPAFDESALSDTSKEDFSKMIKAHAHRPIKGIERWL